MALRLNLVQWRVSQRLLERHLRGYERVVVALFGVGGLALVAGLSLALARPPAVGVWVASAGLALVCLAIELAHPLSNLRTFGAAKSGGATYDRMRTWARMRAVAVTLHGLTRASAVVLGYAVGVRAGVFQGVPEGPLAARGPIALGLVLNATLVVAALVALRTPLERAAKPGSALHPLASVCAVLFAALAAMIENAQQVHSTLILLRAADAPFLLLAAGCAASFALFDSRDLPTLYALFTEPREYYEKRGQAQRSVMLPAMIAIVLLFVVFTLLVVVQVGLFGALAGLSANGLLLAVVVIVLLAMVASVCVSFVLTRSEKSPALYRRKRDAETKQDLVVLVASGSVAGLLLLVALLVAAGVPLGLDPHRWVDVAAVGIMGGLGPYGFHVARKARRTRKLEERFPDFLRDLASSRRAGLTLEQAVTIAARGEYGALTPEIRKMADQLSWHVPFDEALRRFSERVRTPLVQRAVSLIQEASRTGGHVTDVLMAAALDVREIKNLETERRMTMGLYTAIMYITFGVFLIVAVLLYDQFLPPIAESADAALASGTATVAGLAMRPIPLESYRTFFMLAAVAQGVGNGLVAGLVECGRVLQGLKHGFAMVLVAWVTFTLVL